jgi:hypothetical protein
LTAGFRWTATPMRPKRQNRHPPSSASQSSLPSPLPHQSSSDNALLSSVTSQAISHHTTCPLSFHFFRPASVLHQPPIASVLQIRIGDAGDCRPLENGSDAGMCSSTAMPWTAWSLTAARTTAKWLVKGPMSSRDYAETVGHIPTGTCSVQKARSRRLIAVSAGQHLCGAPAGIEPATSSLP